MSSQFLPLEEAAKRLGITSERMVELRSQGKIRGFRDGASWKFPENELDRLADELASESGAYDPYKGFDEELADEDSDDFSAHAGGSGVLVDELELGSSSSPRSGSNIIGGDAKPKSGHGSDVGVGAESLVRSGSDVNLVAGDSGGSDVRIVTGQPAAGDSDDFLIDGGREPLLEIDSGELQLSADEPVITHDSAVLDLAIEPNAGSTGPITDKELKEVASQHPDLLVGKKPITTDSGLKFDQDDSDDDMIGVQNDDDFGDDLALQSPEAPGSGGLSSSSRGSNMSSLEMLDDLDLGAGDSGNLSSGRSSRGVDVLSELDLLSADAGGSGLITGDSGQVIGSGGGGSGTGSKANGLEFDDAL
ncbi:MAG: helix-turn-helix domain-containing protein, partial [Planctomycetaceae bacterium]